MPRYIGWGVFIRNHDIMGDMVIHALIFGLLCEANAVFGTFDTWFVPRVRLQTRHPLTGEQGYFSYLYLYFASQF